MTRSLYIYIGLFSIGCLVGASTPATSHAAPKRAGVTPARFNIPRTDKAPTLDGKIGDDEWSRAVRLTGLVGGGARLSAMQAAFSMCWDDEHLYLACRSWVMPGQNLAAHDSGRWADTFELAFFLDGRERDNADEPLRGYKFFVDVKGVYGYDTFLPETMQKDPRDWSPTIRSAQRTIVDPDNTYGPGTRRWEVELAIPRKAFGLDQPNAAGDPWRFLLCRNTSDPRRQLTIPVAKGFFNPDGFVVGTLTRGEPFAQMGDVLPLMAGRPELRVTVVNPADTAKTIPGALEVFDAGHEEAGARVSEAGSLKAGDRYTLTIENASREASASIRDGARLSLTVGENRDRPALTYEANVVVLDEIVRAMRRRDAGGIAATMTRMVFTRKGDGLLTVDENGIEKRLSYVTGGHVLPRLSPDGSTILYTAFKGKDAGLWIVDIDSGRQRRLCDGREGSWWPDGESVVLRRGESVVRHRLEDGKESSLTGFAKAACRYPAVSPDGDLLASVSRDDEAYGRLVLKRLPEGNLAQIAGRVRGPVSWSPDGARLAFSDGVHIHVLTVPEQHRASADANAPKAEARQVTWEGGFKTHPVWSRDGKAIAYCQSPRPNGPWEVRAIDAAGKTASVLVKDEALPGADVHFTATLPGRATRRPMMTARPVGGHLGLYWGGSEIGRLANAGDLGDAVDIRGGRVVSVPDGAQETLVLRTRAVQWVALDRLGNDLPLDLMDGDAHVDHYNVLLGRLPSGQMLVVAFEARSAVVRRTGGAAPPLASIAVEKSPVIVGIVDPASSLVVRKKTDWNPPFDALWRVSATDPDSMASIVIGAKGDPSGILPQGEGGPVEAVVYPFGRTPATPSDAWTVTDVLVTGAGRVDGMELLHDSAVTGYTKPERWTAYPSVATTVEAIREAHRNRWLPETIARDIDGWCADVETLTRSMDERLAAYDRVAETMLFAGVEEESLKKAIDRLQHVKESKKGFIPFDKLTAACASMAKGGRDELKSFVDVTTQAAGQRRKALRAYRRATIALRNAAARALADRDELAKGGAASHIFKTTTRILSKRHLAEGQWRGEPAELPYERGWWGNVF